MSLKEFTLDQRLATDCVLVMDLPLSQLLLNRDANYPWFILVPKVPGATELIDLNGQQQQQLQKESNLICRFLKMEVGAEKLNVAALGNVVSQLHIHHIARFSHDPSWPAPIWNAVPASEYTATEIERLISAFKHYYKKHSTGE